MEFKCQEVNYLEFGKCLTITNGFIELVVSLEFGPRVLSFKSKEAKNIFLEDDKKAFFISYPETVSIYGDKDIFYLRGGHRLWVSPETYYTYYPDNEPVSYDVIGNRVILYQPVQKITKVKLTMEIEIQDKNKVMIKHIIKNKDRINKKIAPWGITVFKGPGLEIIPMPKNDTGFIPQRHISYWGYGAKANDARIYLGDKFSSLQFATDKFAAIKIGFKVIDNYALYATEESVFVKRFIYDKSCVYPDNNVNYETYTNGKILEMETVGGLVDLQPGEQVEHDEFWSIYKNDSGLPKTKSEKAYQSFVDKYIKD